MGWVAPYINNHLFKDFTKFKILWVGKLDFRKQLNLALKIIQELKEENIIMTICATGSQTQENYFKNLVNKYNIEDKIIWKGKVEHNRINAFMQSSDL